MLGVCGTNGDWAKRDGITDLHPVKLPKSRLAKKSPGTIGEEDVGILPQLLQRGQVQVIDMEMGDENCINVLI
jgi:hypothetical protein